MDEHEEGCCDGVYAAQQAISNFVEQGRWGVIGVGASETDSPFSYTVGLHYKKLPELIMVGISPQIAIRILNDCAEKMVVNGAGFKHGCLLDDLANMPLAIIDVIDSKKKECAVQAYNHYQHWDFGMQQLVMPDRSGKFPWEGDFELKMKEIQDVLGTPPAFMLH